MNIILNFQSNVNAAPAGFKAAIQEAANYFDRLYTNNITVTLDINYGNIASGASAGSTADYLRTYSTYRNALLSQSSQSADDLTAAAFLGASDPTGGSAANWFGGNALDKALGLTPYSTIAGISDGTVNFQADGAGGVHYNYDVNNRGVSGLWDLVGVAEHEISHALGRVSLVGQNGDYSPLDLFRYQGNGSSTTRDFVDGTAAHFSIDGGTTNLANFALTSDTGDWDASSGLDPNAAFSSIGAAHYFTQTDVRELDVLGYTRAHITNDGNGDGVSDVLFRNDVTGQLIARNMDSGNGVSWQLLTPGLNTDYVPVGSGDTDGNFNADAFIQQQSTGRVILALNGPNGFTGWGLATPNLTPDWKARAVYDVNHDGSTDVIVQDQTNGNTLVANVINGNFASWTVVTFSLNANWVVEGVGDIQKTGYGDIVMRDQTTGTIMYVDMTGGTAHGFNTVVTNLGANWVVRGVGDINGDGYADLIVQDSNTGATQYADMSGGSFHGWHAVTSALSTDYVAKGVYDLHGNGAVDIVFQQQSTGATIYAEMSGGTFNHFGNVYNAALAGWHLV